MVLTQSSYREGTLCEGYKCQEQNGYHVSFKETQEALATGL